MQAVVNEGRRREVATVKNTCVPPSTHGLKVCSRPTGMCSIFSITRSMGTASNHVQRSCAVLSDLRRSADKR